MSRSFGIVVHTGGWLRQLVSTNTDRATELTGAAGPAPSARPCSRCPPPTAPPRPASPPQSAVHRLAPSSWRPHPTRRSGAGRARPCSAARHGTCTEGLSRPQRVAGSRSAGSGRAHRRLAWRRAVRLRNPPLELSPHASLARLDDLSLRRRDRGQQRGARRLVVADLPVVWVVAHRGRLVPAAYGTTRQQSITQARHRRNRSLRVIACAHR